MKARQKCLAKSEGCLSGDERVAFENDRCLYLLVLLYVGQLKAPLKDELFGRGRRGCYLGGRLGGLRRSHLPPVGGVKARLTARGESQSVGGRSWIGHRML